MKKYWTLNVRGFETEEYNLANDCQTPWAARRYLPSTPANLTHHYLYYGNNLYDKQYSLEVMELYEGSTEVDFIFGRVELGGYGLIVSERVLELLLQYKLPTYEHIPINTFHLPTNTETNKIPIVNRFFHSLRKDTKVQYRWLHILREDAGENIDFSQSIILEIKKKSFPLITNYQRFQNIDFTKKPIFEKIVFKSNFSFDIFKIENHLVNRKNYNYIISNRLKIALENMGVTGLYPFEEVKEIVCLEEERTKTD